VLRFGSILVDWSSTANLTSAGADFYSVGRPRIPFARLGRLLTHPGEAARFQLDAQFITLFFCPQNSRLLVPVPAAFFIDYISAT
jgi:hypothetical protein